MNASHLARRTATTLVAALAAAAVAAPAQALRPDDRAVRPSVGAPAANPYDRGFGGVDELPSATSTHPDDRAERISPTAVPALPAAADGFDWADAGIGAGGAFALVLVGLGASAAGFRSRRATALSS